MAALRAFAKLTSVYVVGEVLVLAGGLISFPIFTRLLQTDEYGLMTLVLSTVAFAEIAATLGLRHAAVRLYYGHELRGDGPIFTNTLFWGSVLLGLSGALLVALGGAVLGWVHVLTTDASVLLALASGLVLVRVTTKILASFFRLRNRILPVTLLAVLVRYVGMVLAIVMVAAHGLGVFGFFLGVLTGETAVLACFVVMGWREVGLSWPSVRWSLFREALSYGLPLTLASAGGAVLANGDRFVIGHLLGAGSVALYAVPYNLCSYVSGLLVAAYEFAFVPMIMERWEKKGAEDARWLASSVIKLYAVVAIPIIVGLSALGEPILALIASAKYRSAASILTFVVIGEMLRGVITPLTIGLQFAKRTGTMAGLSWLAAASNIALNFILVPQIGLIGAGIATLCSYVGIVVAGALVSGRYFAFPIPWRQLGEYLLAAAVMLVVLRGLAGQPLWLASISGAIVYGAGVLLLSADARSTLLRLLGRRGA